MAVDLFFVLSGFVISNSYSAKIVAGMTFAKFMLLRLIRLAPLYFFGLVLGIVAMALAINIHSDLNLGLVQISQAAALGSIGVPFLNDIIWPFGQQVIRGPLFPLNDPAWSLFFELIINIIFFFTLYYFRRLPGLPSVAVAYIIFIGVTVGLRQFNPGWGQLNFIYGFPRVAAEFFFGSLIFTMGWYRRKPQPLLAVFVTVAMVSVFAIYGRTSALVNMLLLMPLTVVLLSAVRVSGWLRRCCHVLGDISYPLYIIHFPIYRFLADMPLVASLTITQRTLFIVAVALGVSGWLISADKRIRERLSRFVPTNAP